MNRLPDHRHIINGRTFDRPWRAADYDPIERPDTFFERVAGFFLACAIGAGLAAVLFTWWSS